MNGKTFGVILKKIEKSSLCSFDETQNVLIQKVFFSNEKNLIKLSSFFCEKEMRSILEFFKQNIFKFTIFLLYF